MKIQKTCLTNHLRERLSYDALRVEEITYRQKRSDKVAQGARSHPPTNRKLSRIAKN